MKDLFPEYSTEAKDHANIWKEALFVFDTNVLLNLYRYGKETREEFFEVLQQLSPRIWIPHYVALEFHRNRLGVIAEQSSLFTDARKAVTLAKTTLVNELGTLRLDRRHSSIRPDTLIADISTRIDHFVQELAELQKSQQQLTGSDPVLERIQSLFDGRAGRSPSSQQQIDKIYADGELRYKRRLPPGYIDSKKDKKDDGDDEFSSGGLCYRRKFGDLLIWSQLLEHAKSENLHAVILVTNDQKDDWFLKVDCEGPQTIGPRPELVEEARRVGGIAKLLIYTAERFFKFAGDFGTGKVTNTAITEVRDVADLGSDRQQKPNGTTPPKILRAFGNWFSLKYHIHGWSMSAADTVRFEAEPHTIEVMVSVFDVTTSVGNLMDRAVSKGIKSIDKGCDAFALALVIPHRLHEIGRRLQISRIESFQPPTLDILVGIVVDNEFQLIRRLPAVPGTGLPLPDDTMD